MRPTIRIRYRDLFRGREVATLAVVALAYALSVAALLVLVGRIVRALSGHDQGLPIFLLIGLLAVVGLVHASLKSLEFSIPENVGFRIVRVLRLRLYRHMAAMAPRQIQHRSRGSLILRLTGDLTMLRTWLSRGLCRGAIATLALVAAMAVVAWYSAAMALVIAGWFAFGTSASIFVGRSMQRLTARVRRRRSLLTSNVDEQVSALSVVQLFGRQRGEENRFDRQNVMMTEALYDEAVYRGVLRGISSATGWMALASAFAVGAREMSLGAVDVSGILVAVLATRMMQAHVRTLSLSHDYWRRAEISRRKVEDFLNSRSRLGDGRIRERFTQNRARIEFEDVFVRGSLDGVTADIAAGQHIALVGRSGSGKTSLLLAVANMVDCDEGRVRIGGQLAEICEPSSLWRKMGMVGPDLPLMRGTLRRNLTYRKPGVSEEELQDHIARCHLEELIADLPGGLDFWVTEGGLNLPAGVRQRIAIARALLGNPPILLLDRMTAGLDAAARADVRAMIGRYSATILSITEDADEIALADEVWTMDHGKLVSRTPSAAYLAVRHRRPPVMRSVHAGQ